MFFATIVDPRGKLWPNPPLCPAAVLRHSLRSRFAVLLGFARQNPQRRVDAEGGDAASEEQKEAVQFMAVQTEVLKAQKEVGQKLGFTGEEGYVAVTMYML